MLLNDDTQAVYAFCEDLYNSTPNRFCLLFGNRLALQGLTDNYDVITATILSRLAPGGVSASNSPIQMRMLSTEERESVKISDKLQG